ncbi:hypothetical protein [Amycolatopsis coloradensis]|uniref:hypothetical protein n=1 Tax=Amycolatopsis coloradensis TaxID=76021 RepID=UPI001300EFEF|nr:hypothetical protein [Amycolatopsis coloradensis]
MRIIIAGRAGALLVAGLAAGVTPVSAANPDGVFAPASGITGEVVVGRAACSPTP